MFGDPCQISKMFKKKLEFLDNSSQSTHMYVVCIVIKKTSEKICIVFTKCTGTVLCFVLPIVALLEHQY